MCWNNLFHKDHVQVMHEELARDLDEQLEQWHFDHNLPK
jgi:hypothetical protein